jgi:hypothetical protein
MLQGWTQIREQETQKHPTTRDTGTVSYLAKRTTKAGLS